MTNEELKSKILDNSLSDNLLILRYEDNKFICKQYVNEISKKRNLEILSVETLEECIPDEFFGDINNYLYLIDIDNLEKIHYELINDDLKNIIIICNKIPKEIEKEYDKYIVNIVKILDWQILEYMKTKCSLSETNLKWIQEVSKNNIYRIDNELNKLAIFESSKQDDIFNQIKSESGYNDLNSFDVFKLTNAIIKKDYTTILEILKSIDNMDVEPFGLLTILYNNFKNIINIQLNPNATADSLGMQPKQFNAVKYNCGKYSSGQLLQIFNFLTTLDSRVKGGEIPLDDNQFIDYIVCSVLNGG